MQELTLLLADDDPDVRAQVAARAKDAVKGLAVLEAEDGAQAVQLGLQQRPRLALLDVQVPRLDGIAAASTIRELDPQIRIALYTTEAVLHRERARKHSLPLFDELDVDGAIRWLELQVRTPVRRPRETLTFQCSACGYGAARAAEPERCPMCQRSGTWIHRSRRPLGFAPLASRWAGQGSNLRPWD
jgi:CheY-like chemotaxis protein